jgi:hypothetical protein
MPQTLSFPISIATVVTMKRSPLAAANGQRSPRYLRIRGVIDVVEEAASLVPGG